MLVELIDDRGHPHAISAQRVVIRDTRTGTPISLALEAVPGQYLAATAADGNAFQTMLREMRISDTVLVTNLTPGTIPDISIG